LAESRELLQVTLDSIGDGVVTAGVDGTVTWMNPVAERLTGWIRDEAQGMALAAVCRMEAERDGPGEADAVVSPEHWAGGRGARELVLVSRFGGRCAVQGTWTPIRAPNGAVHGAVAVLHDVSDQRRMARELRHRATHDALTGLPNRAWFEGQLERAVRRGGVAAAGAGGTRGDVLLLVDLDRFKAVNDRFGHSAGDRLLRQVAALLRNSVRESDLVARLGGDEFAVILRRIEPDQAERVAQGICNALEESRFVHGEQRLRIGASIGLVALRNTGLDPAGAMRAADHGCFQAKESGRNRVHAWEDADPAGLARAREICWLSRLEQALDEDGFVLHAQRIEPLAGTDGVLRYEVLLRLRDGDGGILMPGQFMPAAERFRLAGRIDRWVVRAVFRLLELGPVPPALGMLCVNLSGQSIEDPSFRLFMREMIAGARFDLGLLCFEITETAVIGRLGEARMLVDELRGAGIRVALDDFGAGASWFSYLKSLPVDFLKIDGQFVRDLLGDPLNRAAIRCFREVADSLGVRCIAEFVEEEVQREALLALGVELGQGYLIHRPAPLFAMLAGGGDDPAAPDPTVPGSVVAAEPELAPVAA
ncbi:MAG: EAL domain-containing protein, partial [Gluconacetobacter diazotrophicus]|nr:EAL domain-containing protein [Gluconacetobacter diazotrophicus]